MLVSVFIEVKLRRALFGRGHFDPEFEDPVQNDYNGCAKVTAIAVGHCLSAGHLLLSYMPEVEAQNLNMLAHLQQLKSMINREFPEWRNFVRPGFDTLGINENLGV